MRGLEILNSIYPIILNNSNFNDNQLMKVLIGNNLFNPILEFIERLKMN